MILKIKHTKKSLPRLDLITSSFVIVYFAALFYPHMAIGGGLSLAGKTILELLIFSAFAFYATAKLSLKEPILEKSPLSMPLVALTVLIIVASIFAQNWPIAIEALFLYLAYLGCFHIFLSLLKDANQQVSLVYIISFITVALCLWGLLQYYLINLKLENVWRLRSTFGNCDHMAGFLSMTIPLYLGTLFFHKFSKKTSFALICVLILMLITLLLTYARGGWIATASGISFIIFAQVFLRKYSLKKMLPVGLTVLLTLLIVFLSSTYLVNRFNTMTQEDTDVTLYGRKLAWNGTIEMITANPIVGIGPGNYPKAFRTFQPPGLTNPYIFGHNDYLHFISETGVLLIPIIIWLLFCLLNHGWEKVKHTDSQMGAITLGSMGGIVAILVYSLSDYNLHIPANALLFTLLAAIVAAPKPQLEIQDAHTEYV